MYLVVKNGKLYIFAWIRLYLWRAWYKIRGALWAIQKAISQEQESDKKVSAATCTYVVYAATDIGAFNDIVVHESFEKATTSIQTALEAM